MRHYPTLAIFAQSVSAAASQSKATIVAASRWPKYGAQAVDISQSAHGSNTETKGGLKETFLKNGDSKICGLYASYRVGSTVVAPVQSLAVGSTGGSADNGKAEATISSFTTATQQSFYEYRKANEGKYWVSEAATLVTAANINDNGKYGEYMGACLKTGLASATESFKGCWSMTSPLNNTAAKVAAVANRVLITTDATTDVTCGNETGKLTCKLFVVDEDLILASFYQANGGDVDGSTWCSDTFYNKLSASDTSEKTFSGQKGFGPKGKCTWQVVSSEKSMGPAISFKNSPKAELLIQVIEWYTITQLTGNAIIDPAKAKAAPGYIGKDDNSYKATTGVFLNPVKTNPFATGTPNFKTATLGEYAQTTNFSGPYASSNALNEVPNSIGTAVYYERDAGQGKDTIRQIESTLFTEAYGVYNAVVTGYNSEKSTYDSAKTTYETAVEDRKKDPKKTLPERPNMPSVPAAYSGPKLLLSTQIVNNVSDEWGDEIKKMTGMEGLLVTDGTTAANKVFDLAKLSATFHQRIRYLTATADTSGTVSYDGVGATFGRLGQGVSTTYAKASPFLWQKEDTNAMPGMQVSLFPEYVTASTWSDWTLSSSSFPQVGYGIKKFAVASDFNAPSPPTAATPIKDAASQLFVATAISTAAIASTLF